MPPLSGAQYCNGYLSSREGTAALHQEVRLRAEKHSVRAVFPHSVCLDS